MTVFLVETLTSLINKFGPNLGQIWAKFGPHSADFLNIKDALRFVKTHHVTCNIQSFFREEKLLVFALDILHSNLNGFLPNLPQLRRRSFTCLHKRLVPHYFFKDIAKCDQIGQFLYELYSKFLNKSWQKLGNIWAIS